MIEGADGFRRDLSIDYNGNIVSLKLLQPKLPAHTAALIEIAWPIISPVESWETESTQLLRYIGPSPNPQMQELEVMARNPAPAHDLAMGRFVRDDQLGWIEAEINWMGQNVKATIEAQLDIDIADQEQLLALLMDRQADWHAHAQTAIIAGLYELWRDGWRQDDAMLTELEFVRRMTIEAIAMQRGGSFHFWFNDGDLFWGHSVLVCGTFDGGFAPGQMHG
jgi:hypothetical protein